LRESLSLGLDLVVGFGSIAQTPRPRTYFLLQALQGHGTRHSRKGHDLRGKSASEIVTAKVYEAKTLLYKIKTNKKENPHGDGAALSALLRRAAVSQIALMLVESVCRMRLSVRSQRRQLLISEHGHAVDLTWQ
jgi:hypothetical protein